MKRTFFVLSFLLILGAMVPGKMLAMATSTLVIDEFRVDGVTTNDEYVVIANYGTIAIDLNLYSLTIKNSATTYSYLYRFGVGSQIRPGEKIRICHNSATDKSLCNLFNTGTSYALKESDGVIALIANSTTTKTNIDIVGYGEIDYGTSGCWASGCEEYPLDTPVKNTPYRRVNGVDTNRSFFDFTPVTAPVFVDPNASKLLISELMPSPSEGSEWIELFNPTSQTVSLAGLKLCDAMGRIHCYYFKNDAILSPLEYKIYSQTDTKITLNNSGDWVEIRDLADNLISDSGGDYGAADSGLSLSLFGDEFRWTKTPTPAVENIYTDIIELETVAASTPKSTSKKVKKASVKASSITEGSLEKDSPSAVAGVSKVAATGARTDKGISGNNTLLGYVLIALAVLLFVGYNLWDNKDAVRNFYYKISRRNH